MYVIQDNRFWLLSSLAGEGREGAGRLLAFPSGLLRGALANLGIATSVTATLDALPALKFHVTVLPSK